MGKLMSIVPCCVLFFLMVGVAEATPPPNADPSLAPWYESLKQPETGGSCCSISDCRPAAYRIQNGHYEAFIDGDWREVPPMVVLHRTDNPTGEAVACYYQQTHKVLCFIPGPKS